MDRTEKFQKIGIIYSGKFIDDALINTAKMIESKVVEVEIRGRSRL